jgi:hypothetical protein
MTSGDEGAYLPYEDLVWACANLCDLLEVENDALREHDAVTVQDLAENKIELAQIYDQSVQPMAKNPSLVSALTMDQREELKTLGLRLASLVDTNVRLLQAEMAACHHVMEIMVEALKSQARERVPYSRHGTPRTPSKGRDSVISLNKTL